MWRISIAKLLAFAVLLWLGCANATDLTPGYSVGVYYFPGWKSDAPGAPAKRPWESLKKFPGKEPLLGWYEEDDDKVVASQIKAMKKGGIDFVAFDWYWSEKNKPYLEHALPAFIAAPEWKGMKFALLWANHMKVPNSLDNFSSMIRYVSRYYFSRPDYLRFDGRPVFFLFSQQNLKDRAGEMGMHPKELLKLARRIAREEGHTDLYIVGAAEAVAYWVTEYGKDTGYDAYSAYNYHRGFQGKFVESKPVSHSYEELSQAYQMTWDWILKNSPVPYIVPGTAGWDKTPWGGSKDRRHDNSEATPAEFEAHLLKLRQTLDKYPEKTRKTTVLCCWNEHGEGSVIEPTKQHGYTRIESIVKVFGKVNK